MPGACELHALVPLFFQLRATPQERSRYQKSEYPPKLEFPTKLPTHTTQVLNTECAKKAGGLTRDPGTGLPQYRYLNRDTGHGTPLQGRYKFDYAKTGAPNRAGQEAAARQFTLDFTRGNCTKKWLQ